MYLAVCLIPALSLELHTTGKMPPSPIPSLSLAQLLKYTNKFVQGHVDHNIHRYVYGGRLTFSRTCYSRLVSIKGAGERTRGPSLGPLEMLPRGSQSTLPSLPPFTRTREKDLNARHMD